jgi:hypothetical protein
MNVMLIQIASDVNGAGVATESHYCVILALLATSVCWVAGAIEMNVFGMADAI